MIIVLNDKKRREKELTALSYGAGEDCYVYNGLREEQTNQLLTKLNLQPHEKHE